MKRTLLLLPITIGLKLRQQNSFLLKQFTVFITLFLLYSVMGFGQPSSCASSTLNQGALNGNSGFGQSVTMSGCTHNNAFYSFAWTNRNTPNTWTTGTLTIYNGESTDAGDQIYTQALTGLDGSANTTNTIVLSGGTGTINYVIGNVYTFRINNLNGTGTHNIQESDFGTAYTGGRWLSGTTFDASNRDIVFDLQTTFNPLPSSCASSTLNQGALNGNSGFGQSVTMSGCTYNNFFYSFAWTNRNTPNTWTTGTLTIYNGESTDAGDQIYTQALTGLDGSANTTNTIVLSGGTGTLNYVIGNVYTFRINNLNGTGTHNIQESDFGTAYTGGRWLSGTTFDASNRDIVFDLQTVNNPLPVELISFNAKAMENYSLLNWRTASEINNEGFEIERSLDGIDWKVLEFVEGNGTTSAIQSYNYTDRLPMSGHNYYRLKQIDFDGKYEYSAIRTVRFDASQNQISQVFPNPNNGQFTVSLYNPYGESGLIKLFASTGNLIWEKSFNDGETQVNFENEFDLPQEGVYFLSTQVGQHTETHKILMKD